MEFTVADHLVHKKDSKGATYVLGEIAWNNEKITHDPYFYKVGNILEELPQFPTRDDDIWILGYLKSGTHWLNEIINLLTWNATTPPLGGKQSRFIEFVGQTDHFEKMASPRILNTHLLLKYMPQHVVDNAKIIFPLRNPKSIAVSLYYHRRNLTGYQYDGIFEGFLPIFMQGIESLYGSWFDMVIPYWEHLKGKSNVHFVVYEDLLKNPVEGIKKISDFLGLGHDFSYCEHVTQQAKFEAMQQREQQAMSDCTFLKGKEGFIRKGSPTDWKTHFTVAQNEKFDAAYEEKMRDYPDLKALIKFQ